MPESENRKAGKAVLDAVKAAIANDPDVQVRRRAVDALASRPDGKGVPALIQLVKSSKDLDVRKQAMNKLQNSHDSRGKRSSKRY
jgi:HEAT repeat protein